MPKVLIIDDESTIRELFRFIFSDAGFEVLLAPDGREALGILESHRPDFIVVDISMPVMTGLEFVARLGELAAGDPGLDAIPFVVMTGENFIDPGIGGPFALRPGFIGYFPKMTPPERVLARAREVLAGRKPPSSPAPEPGGQPKEFTWPWNRKKPGTEKAQ